MSRRLPEQPPGLAGYTYIRPLGSGGFADVFLYEQSMPRRTVAVKVLLSSVSSVNVREMFLSETMLMAQLASHPSVLTVYEANISPDGRPYLVMEYCPSSYGHRFRTELLPLSEVLQVAVAIGSVLETAHRDGVLHRDIKPANVLQTTYGKPVLADFGIASTIARSERQEATGMSIPWSAPEVITGATQGNIRTEVWAFAATVYSLLAQRSPFEVLGKNNTRDDVQQRIVARHPVGPIGRPDVPATVERILLAGLSKNPANRPASIVEMLREVQVAESELGLRPSVLDIPSERVIDARDLAGASQRGDTPSGRSDASTTGRRSRIRTRPNGTTGRAITGGSGSETDATVLKAWSANSRSAAKRRRGVIAAWVGGGVAAAAAIGIVAALALGGGQAIPQVTNISSKTAGSSVTFAWGNPGLSSDDTYLVRVNDSAGEVLTSNTYTVDTNTTGSRVCITVTVVRKWKERHAERLGVLNGLK